jgi:serine/threonine protein phosphatase PrpC
MVARKKGPETPLLPERDSEARDFRDSEKPTDRPPKIEKAPGVLNVETATFMKNKEGAVNEDAYLTRLDTDKKGGLFAVADGMGGVPGGDIASNTVVETVQKYASEFQAIRQKRLEGDETASLEAEAALLRRSLREANARVVLKREQYPDRFHHMGSTCTAVRLTNDREGAYHAIIGHVGDSRAYVLHPDGALETLTLDDHLSLAVTKHLYDEPTAIAVQDILDQLSSEEEFAEYAERLKNGTSFPEGSPVSEEQITFLQSHMGAKERSGYFNDRSRLFESFGYKPHIKMKTVPLSPGSKLILATDAIEGLRRDEFEAVVRGDFDSIEDSDVAMAASVWASNPAEAIAHAARERGGAHGEQKRHPKSKGPDDATVVMVEVPER